MGTNEIKRSQVTLKRRPQSPGMFIVDEGCEFLGAGTVTGTEYIKKNLSPVNGEALMLADPNRNESLCLSIINKETPPND